MSESEPEPRDLKGICQYLGISCDYSYNPRITDIVQDSRQVTPGAMFYARLGARHDGRDYLDQAIAAGASAILCSYSYQLSPRQRQQCLSLPVIILPEQFTIGALANWFYNYPSSSLKVIGITGTNGKTTCTHMLASLLENLGHRCAIIGTLGWGFPGELRPSANTTPDGLEIQKELSALLQEGAEYVALEVSSIGISEQRVRCLDFSAGGFTNLSRDHLDYHHTMEAYAEAKRQFLSRVTPERVAVNIHDKYGNDFAHVLTQSLLVGYKTDKRSLSLMASTHKYCLLENVRYSRRGIELRYDTSYGKGRCQLNLLGKFNVENFSLCLGVLLSMGFLLDDILSLARDIPAVPGRMECFEGEHQALIIVDYAHTPAGVEQVLKSAREHIGRGNVYCVLGCGGDRDRGKRPVMAQKACIYADYVVFTQDNPRSEDPQHIIDDMLTGVAQSTDNYEIVLDRREAVLRACAMAGEGDCVVIAGKGHEDRQVFSDHTVQFSDRQLAREIIASAHDQL